MLEFVEFPGSTMLKVGSVATVGSGADARTVINFVPTNGLQETWISGVGSLAGPLYRGLLNPSEYIAAVLGPDALTVEVPGARRVHP